MGKVDLRIPQIARMRVAGHKDEIIAQTVGLSLPGLKRILTLQEYKDVEQAVLQGTISKMDVALAGRADLLRREFQVGVPLAMRTLLEAVQQRRDLRAALGAAKELLDRDPDRTFVANNRAEPASVAPTLTGEVLAALGGHADTVGTKLAGVVSDSGGDVHKVNVPAESVSTKVQ